MSKKKHHLSDVAGLAEAVKEPSPMTPALAEHLAAILDQPPTTTAPQLATLDHEHVRGGDNHYHTDRPYDEQHSLWNFLRGLVALSVMVQVGMVRRWNNVIDSTSDALDAAIAGGEDVPPADDALEMEPPHPLMADMMREWLPLELASDEGLKMALVSLGFLASSAGQAGVGFALQRLNDYLKARRPHVIHSAMQDGSDGALAPIPEGATKDQIREIINNFAQNVNSGPPKHVKDALEKLFGPVFEMTLDPTSPPPPTGTTLADHVRETLDRDLGLRSPPPPKE